MNPKSGFTLIELSIVLVIIGLLVGGVLVGRDLISAATVRAQITQIEKYQTAVNVFKMKYGNWLPGDMPDPYATQQGLVSRSGTCVFNGNFLLESDAVDIMPFDCEDSVFWVDLSRAGLIDGGFSRANGNSMNVTASGTVIDQYFPKSKIGFNGHVYVYTGGYQYLLGAGGNGMNYFQVTNVIQQNIDAPLMTVNQAYSLDKKIDDGFPQLGNVTAYDAMQGWISNGSFVNGDYDQTTDGPVLPSSGSVYYATDNGATLSQTCYNNGHTKEAEHYSVEVNNGTGVNCSLSFKFQ